MGRNVEGDAEHEVAERGRTRENDVAVGWRWEERGGFDLRWVGVGDRGVQICEVQVLSTLYYPADVVQAAAL
jgi:hypothetical protein